MTCFINPHNTHVAMHTGTAKVCGIERDDECDCPMLAKPIANDQACNLAVKAAMTTSERIRSRSNVFKNRIEAEVPLIKRENVILGSLLDSGGFSNIYEVKQLNMKLNQAPDTTNRNCNDSKRYVIKCLSPSTMSMPQLFESGASDLATESMFLSSLEHPNIIKIQGISSQGLSGFASGVEGGFFIVLDRIETTLKDRLKMWDLRNKNRRASSFRQMLPNKSEKIKQHNNFLERLNCAAEVCAGLNYLHSHGILFRDIKPGNIGFDYNGNVKIFDFGFARELDHQDMLEDGLYNLTGFVGTPRYMAPEVAKYEPYNLSADVYSFSILLWTICSLKMPFYGLTKEKHHDFVVRGSLRPSLDTSWPSSLCSLITSGWSEELKERPKLSYFHFILKKEISVLQDGDGVNMGKSRRRFSI